MDAYSFIISVTNDVIIILTDEIDFLGQAVRM